MGLLDFLSPALNVATSAAGTYENAQANAAQQRQQQIIQNLMMQRQQQQQELHNNLVRSQTGEANARIGDIAAQQKIRENQALHPKPNYAPPVIGPNGEVQLVNYDDPTHPTRVPGIQGKVERQPQEAKDQLVQVTGADGKLHYVWANPQSHTTTPANIDPRQPKAGGAGVSASGAQVPVADMEQRYQEIAAHAKNLGNGDWKMTPGMQTREGFDYAVGRETAAGHPSLPHTIASATMNLLGVGGGDYQNYQALMNSSRALGDDVAKVFKGRQNEEAVNREVQLARLTPEDYQNQQVVEQKLSRLRHIIDLAKHNNPDQASIGGGGGASQAQQLWDAAVKKYGQEETIRQIGQRPTE